MSVGLLADTLTGVPFSWNPLDDIQQLLSFQFMRSAYTAGTAAAVVAGVVGYFVVLRGLSFAGHSLSTMGFAGATGAQVVGADPLFGLFAINSVAALLMGLLGKRSRGRDVVVGVVLTGTVGLGLLFLRLYRAQEATPVLVGQVLGISSGEVTVTVVASALIVVLVAVVFRPLLFSSLDEGVAEARGVDVGVMSVLLLLILAATTSIATPIVGVLLTFSLLIAPAATAVLLTSRPARTLALSVALGVAYIWTGLAVSYWIDLPPSVFVTGIAFVVYVAARARPALLQRAVLREGAAAPA